MIYSWRSGYSDDGINHYGSRCSFVIYRSPGKRRRCWWRWWWFWRNTSGSSTSGILAPALSSWRSYLFCTFKCICASSKWFVVFRWRFHFVSFPAEVVELSYVITSGGTCHFWRLILYSHFYFKNQQTLFKNVVYTRNPLQCCSARQGVVLAAVFLFTMG